MVTTIGKLRLNEIIPEKYHPGDRTLNSKELANMMTEIAKNESPESYMDILGKLTDFGFSVANDYGGPASVKIADLTIPPRLKAMRDELKRNLYKLSQRDDLDSKEKNKRIIEMVRKATPAIDKAVMEELTKGDNSFGLLVGSGSKGKPQQLRQLIFGDLLTVDSKMHDIPYPTLRSYGEGITPLQYWTASHGGRYGYVQVQKATAQTGYFSKQTRGVVHREIITADDCGNPKPVFVDANDSDNIGSLLYKAVKGKSGKVYPANTILTDNILSDLSGNIPIRSAITCGAADGICSKCAGIRESGRLPDIGEAVGLNGINAGNEHFTQMGLCLHEDTLVRMADGTTKRIKEIKAKELVLAADKKGNTFPAPVVANHYNGEKNLVKYTFKVGGRNDYRELMSTPEHKVLQFIYHSNCVDKEILNNTPTIDQIGRTDNKRFAILASAEIDECSSRVYDNRALLLGLLLGDGGYTESVKYVHLSCADDRLIEDITPYLAELNLKPVLSQSKYWYRISCIQDNVTRDPKTGRFNQLGDRNNAKKMLKSFGIYGKYAHEKELPEVCFKWNNKAIAELLSGLWATDGSIYTAKSSKYPYTAFGGTSKKMLEQVKELLEVRFGVYSTPISGSSKNRKHTLYKLSINDMSSVYRLLSVLRLPGVKEQKRLDALALLSDALQERTQFYKTAKAAKKCGEVVGIYPTYDLEIDTTDHLFVLANGLIVSNSSKHSGGESVSAKRVKRGFAAIEQFINMPENFVGGAAITPVEGRVDKIVDAPQGGKDVYIGETKVHVTPDVDVTVKKGDRVEAGDVLSDGMVNMKKVAEFKGLGEARKEFVTNLYNIMASGGSPVPKKQLEPFARAYFDRVEITDPEGLQGWIYGDIASYSALAKHWKPRAGVRETSPEEAIGSYLEMPAAHYTIGTKITRNVANDLAKSGINSIYSHKEAPPFKPHITSAKRYVAEDPDWLTSLSGEGLTRSFLQHVQRGALTGKGTTSYYPDLALVGYGRPESLTL